jgi:hypothetical protein
VNVVPPHPDNGSGSGDGEMVMVNGVGRWLESEVVCGKCDARRLAASIDPHVRRRRHRRRRRRAPRVRPLRVHTLPRFLSHARGAARLVVLLSWARPRSARTLIPAAAGLSLSCTCPTRHRRRHRAAPPNHQRRRPRSPISPSRSADAGCPKGSEIV